jgi:hypothetical protein
MASYFVTRYGKPVAFWAGVAGILGLLLKVLDGGAKTVINVNPSFQQHTDMRADGARSSLGEDATTQPMAPQNAASELPSNERGRVKGRDIRTESQPLRQDVPVKAPNSGRVPTKMQDESLRVSVVRETPLTLRVEGRYKAGERGDETWLGTLSSERLWPQIKLPADPVPGRDFSYTLSPPSDVEAGDIVLLTAGPSARREFQRLLLSNLPTLGVSVEQLHDITVKARTAIP